MSSYGYRARIGYTVPLLIAEIFPFDFYKIAPEGVSLLLATMSVWEGTPEEMKQSAQQSMKAVREMARSGARSIVFGGVPVNLAAGFTSLEDGMKQLSGEVGVPVSASLLCQNAALQALGARNLVVLRSGAGRNEAHMQEIERLGCKILEAKGIGRSMRYGADLTAEETLGVARDLLRAHPDADTLHCPSPHWPMVANIDALEQEFPTVNVVTAGQAIAWKALRLAGISDSIRGYGRLLREL